MGKKTFCLALVLFGLFGCRVLEKKTDEVSAPFQQLEEELRAYIASVRSARSPDEVAAAMNRLAEAYHQAGSKILRFRTRYPDLKKGYRIDQKIADALAGILPD
ncbi:MAG: hypothetical protein KA419_01105 [Acidobacteria bacterium]|nr:hypothetical protein [Acidobacteriota bacterium]